MAILVQFTQSGLTSKTYDDIKARVGWEADPPTGAMFHAVGFDGDTMHAVDVWDTAENMRRYYDQRFAPVAGELGVALADPGLCEIHLMATVPDLLLKSAEDVSRATRADG